MATQPSPLALPPLLSPDDLDTLSELALVLAKVRTGIQSSSGLTAGPLIPPAATAAAAITATNQQQQQQQQQQKKLLSFKDIPGATDSLKHKLQHARVQVRALPDMDRSIAEQRREISALESRIRAQRALLGRLRDDGVCFGKDGDKMDM